MKKFVVRAIPFSVAIHKTCNVFLMIVDNSFDNSSFTKNSEAFYCAGTYIIRSLHTVARIKTGAIFFQLLIIW